MAKTLWRSQYKKKHIRDTLSCSACFPQDGSTHSSEDLVKYPSIISNEIYERDEVKKPPVQACFLASVAWTTNVQDLPNAPPNPQTMPQAKLPVILGRPEAIYGMCISEWPKDSVWTTRRTEPINNVITHQHLNVWHIPLSIDWYTLTISIPAFLVDMTL